LQSPFYKQYFKFLKIFPLFQSTFTNELKDGAEQLFILFRHFLANVCWKRFDYFRSWIFPLPTPAKIFFPTFNNFCFETFRMLAFAQFEHIPVVVGIPLCPFWIRPIRLMGDALAPVKRLQ
jgi:hypothetical protein